jgi:hypothetical protein
VVVDIRGSLWRRRHGLTALGAGLLAALAGFLCAAGLDEGARRHLLKRISELSRMPGRLLT